MNIKPNPNHQLYLQILKRMTPGERLQKAFELSEYTKKLFLSGLRKRFPDKTEEEIKAIYIERIFYATTTIRKGNTGFRRKSNKLYGDNLDKNYLEEWVEKLQVKDLFHKLKEEAKPFNY